jgi:GMP synthase (glutamine-hydrolysing)
MKPILIIQNCAVEKAGSIIDYLNSHSIPYSILHTYKDEPFPDLSQLEAVICMGCPISISEYQNHDFLKKLYSFGEKILHEDIPYLGICFGGQLLAKLLGAQVKRNPVNEIGVYNVHLTSDGLHDPLFSGFDRNFPVSEWHGDTFGIPSDCSLLVEGKDCRNQAFRHGKQVAMQFHFETTREMLIDWCEEFSSDLASFGKTKEVLLEEFSPVETELLTMNYKLLDNFFRIIKTEKNK